LDFGGNRKSRLAWMRDDTTKDIVDKGLIFLRQHNTKDDFLCQWKDYHKIWGREGPSWKSEFRIAATGIIGKHQVSFYGWRLKQFMKEK
jgi:hypothetical protein